MSNDPSIIPKNEVEELLNQARAASAPSSSDDAQAAAAVASAFQAAGGAPSMGDDIQYLLEQAEMAIASVNNPNPTPPDLTPFNFHDLTGEPATQEKATLELLGDVELDLKIELGRTHMYLEDVLKLRRGSVVTLDKLAGDPVDVYVNGRLIARGEVLVLNDNFCVRVAELVAGDDAK